MFIKYIARVIEGIIYILLGMVAATIVMLFFKSLPAEKIEDITEILIFTIFILQPIPSILNKYVNSKNQNTLKQLLSRVVCFLKNNHIALGILFIGLRVLHVEVNLLFESIEWDMETITSILLSILLIPTIIYGILRINDSLKYRSIHRFFLVLTYLTFIVHLFD